MRFFACGRGCFAAPAASRCCACGRKLVLRLRARDGEFRAPARVTFFCCQKKVTKENHLDLRFKDPLARYGSCKIGGAGFAELARWVTLLSVQGSLVPLASLPLTTARVGAGTLVVFGDYQIAPIAARSTAMGRWRLTPPGYWGDTACGRDRRRKTPHPSASLTPVSLRVGPRI